MLLVSCRHLSEPVPGAKDADQALERGAWTKAAEGYALLLADSSPAALDRGPLLFRRALALLATGGAASTAEARKMLLQLVNEHPSSLWAAKALALIAHLDATGSALRALEIAQEQRKVLVAQVALAEEQMRTCVADLANVDSNRRQRDERLAELELTVNEQRATLRQLKTAVERLQGQLDALKRIDLGTAP